MGPEHSGGIVVVVVVGQGGKPDIHGAQLAPCGQGGQHFIPVVVVVEVVVDVVVVVVVEIPSTILVA